MHTIQAIVCAEYNLVLISVIQYQRFFTVSQFCIMLFYSLLNIVRTTNIYSLRCFAPYGIYCVFSFFFTRHFYAPFFIISLIAASMSGLCNLPVNILLRFEQSRYFSVRCLTSDINHSCVFPIRNKAVLTDNPYSVRPFFRSDIVITCPILK
jgi:hypothetical protein